MGCCCKKKTSNLIYVVHTDHLLDKTKKGNKAKKLEYGDFEIQKLIGKGSFAKVYLVRNKKDNKLYSMKKLNKPFIRNHNQEKQIINERILLSNLNNSFLVKLFCCFQDVENLYFIMEFVQGGELFFHLHRETRFDDEKTKFYTAEIVLALNFLHEHNIIYRDLKPENILLDKHGHIKLTDFGLSRICSGKDEKAFTLCGTPFYIAPEIIKKQGYNNSVDWWSLGCLIYEMLTGKPLFNFYNTKIEYKEYEKPIPFNNTFTEEAKDLIKNLLVIDPNKRLGNGVNGFKNLKNHKYFNDIDWDKLEQQKIEPPFVPTINDESDLQNFAKIFVDNNNITRDFDDNPNNKSVDNYVNFTYCDNNSFINTEKNKDNEEKEDMLKE